MILVAKETFGNCLTKGKEYDLIEELENDYVVIDDTGTRIGFAKNGFQNSSEKELTPVEWLAEIFYANEGIMKSEWLEQAKQMEKEQKGYSKKDVLKAGEIGEINHHDYKHIVSLLDEARELNNLKS